jgi:protoporphyrinogen oxidase
VTAGARTIVLGGGVTGLAAGMAGGLDVYEAAPHPGGICASYYVRPGTTVRLPERPADDEAYHFEIGGGHWIFGGDPTVLELIERLTPCRRYTREAGVFFHETGRTVAYPLQHNLRHLDAAVAAKGLAEMEAVAGGGRTMQEWAHAAFGDTLSALFFDPFHERYTAGLYDRIAPQDPYKSPVDLRLARLGASGEPPPVGYNVTFLYPEAGLDALARALAAPAKVRYGARAAGIDTAARTVRFADGATVPYGRLVSTLPLHTTLALAGLRTDAPADPYTSVLVLNLGAVRGPRCPTAHWLYNCRTRAAFHRVGFYSNVDPIFLPRSARARGDRVAIYVERAYPGGARPAPAEEAAYVADAIAELQAWGFVEAVEVADPTWIDVAYTWAWPGSTWRDEALALLRRHGVEPVGRYGRWIFQGIAESIRDGLAAGRGTPARHE